VRDRGSYDGVWCGAAACRGADGDNVLAENRVSVAYGASARIRNRGANGDWGAYAGCRPITYRHPGDACNATRHDRGVA